MKQLFIGQNKAYSSVATANDLIAIPEGVIGLYKLSDYQLLTKAAGKVAEDFMLVVGRGTHAPLVFPEVAAAGLQVTKATYQPGATFTATVTVPTAVEVGEIYSIRINKTDVVFNERNSWSFDATAKDTDGAKVAQALRKAIADGCKYSDALELTVSGTGTAVTVTATAPGKGYTVDVIDALVGATVTSTPAEPVMLDAAYVKDLASRCAAGKGFNYTAQEGRDIYPGYPEVVADGHYVEYTLRFAVGRKASKTRDEVVEQLVHIVVPEGAACVSDLDAILLGKTTQDS